LNNQRIFSAGYDFSKTPHGKYVTCLRKLVDDFTNDVQDNMAGNDDILALDPNFAVPLLKYKKILYNLKYQEF